MAVSWGIKERIKFAAAGPLQSWVPPQIAAIYSITYKQDPVKKPKAHTVLYFGEASNLAEEPPSMSAVLGEVPNFGIGPEDIFIFVHPMPGSTKYERAAIIRSLVGDYRPPGNGY